MEISKVAWHQSVNTFQPNFVLFLVFSDTWLTILVEIKKPPLELLFQNSFGRALWGGWGGGVTPGNSWWRCAARFFKSWPNIRPKKFCKAYENFYKDNPPIPTHYLREMLRLILKENSFQFNGKHYLQTHGTAMGTKTAVSFANIFMAHIETTILSRTVFKPTVWKR